MHFVKLIFNKLLDKTTIIRAFTGLIFLIILSLTFFNYPKIFNLLILLILLLSIFLLPPLTGE